MKKLLLLFFITLSISGSGQTSIYHPFPDSNTIWANAYRYYSTTSIYCYGLIGDTIIDLNQYNKLYRLHDSVLTINGAIYKGAIRESGKKVYYRDLACTHDIILYDFNKNANDTVFSVYSTFEINQCLDSTPIYIIISSTDSIMIGGDYRKVFHFEDDSAIWIEGIGSTVGLLTPIDPGVTGNYEWNLVCFFQNDELMYHNPIFGSCFRSNSGIGENLKKENIDIKVFPNPSNGSFIIDFDNLINVKEIRILNLLGKIVFQQSINKQNKVNIDNLPSGIYILTVIDNENKMTNKKIISSP